MSDKMAKRQDGAVNADAYLERIGISSRPALDAEGLEQLQRAHLTAVPFENLDVYARRGVGTELDWSVPKIVDRRRGGWCFELNGAFSGLLQALGFEVYRRAAVVLLDGATGDPSHLTLEVRLDHPYLVDVGFGDSFIRPLALDVRGPQDGGSGTYAITQSGSDMALIHLDEAAGSAPQYRFDRSDRQLGDFERYSQRLQTEPGLRWTESRFATRLLAGGPDRVTLLEGRVRFRRDGVWSEHPLGHTEWEEQLGRWFGLSP